MQSEQHAKYIARNREHQRSSRARRKEYITDLESRIRQFERDGAQASVAVQVAAKSVAEENQLLRALLNAQGVSTAMIESHLRSCRSNGNLGAADVATKSRRPTRRKSLSKSAAAPKQTYAVTSIDLTSANKKVASERLNTTALGDPLVTSNLPNSTPWGSLASPRLGQLPDKNRDTTCSNKRQKVAQDYAPDAASPNDLYSRVGATQSPTPQPFPPVDEMSCIDAAKIVASLRGHQDHTSLWPELGCSTESECMVKTVRVFELA